MDDELGKYIVAGVVGIILAYMQERTKRAVDASSKARTVEAAEAAKHAKDVKDDLTENTTTTKTVLQVAAATKILVNSGMAVELESHAATARELAEITKEPRHIKLAELAEKKVTEHYLKHCVEAHCPFAGPPPAKEPKP